MEGFRGRKDSNQVLPAETVLKAVVISRPTFQGISRAESGAPGKLLDVTLSSGFLIFRMEII